MNRNATIKIESWETFDKIIGFKGIVYNVNYSAGKLETLIDT